jgi:hypothetical protein
VVPDGEVGEQSTVITLMGGLGDPTAGIKVTRPQEIALYARMFDQLHAEAGYGHDARNWSPTSSPVCERNRGARKCGRAVRSSPLAELRAFGRALRGTLG